MATALSSALLAERTTVRASEFAAVFAKEARGLRVLSLDCFDTLVLRRTAAPTDVFYDLQNDPAFRELGFSAKVRMSAETTARELSQVRRADAEVTLADIYRAAFPALHDEQVRALEDAELEAEMRACYAFPPTVDLLRAAKSAGLRVVVVSDTYLNEQQLRRLLKSVLGEADLGLIDRIFCSSAFGRSKTAGLFGDVLAKLGVKAPSVLHIGDHHQADFLAPKKAGLRALHFIHLDEQVGQVLRLQGTAGQLLCPTVRQKDGLPSPFRGLFAADGSPVDGSYLLGHVATGPILYAFARFILDQLEAWRAQGKNPKPVFLLRDAHLVAEVCRTLSGKEVGPEIAISRFVSYAASFRGVGEIESYLASFAGSRRFAAMAKQLLLPPELAEKIVRQAEAAPNGVARFVELVKKPDVVATIVEESRAYRTRFLRYLEKAAGLAAGDMLVVVDLGYDGTAQRLLEPVLLDELGVEVQGLYLLLARTPGWQRSKKGLVDPSWCDDRVIAGVVPYIALLEAICARHEGSVTDYDDEGTPVLDSNVLGAEQLGKMKPVQAMCCAFAEQAENFFRRVGKRPDPESLRTTALAALGRLLFLPTEMEVSFLENFRLDLNLGTTDSVLLFDRVGGLASLRRRGLFFMEKKAKSWRTNYPVELRHAGTELALTLLAHHRYSLELTQSDDNLRREKVRILAVQGAQATTAELEAHATHDGYFALLLPMGRGDMNVGVMFGERYTWVQIDSIELIPTSALFQDDESRRAVDILAEAALDQLAPRAPRLYECLSDSAFLLLAPGKRMAGADTFACRLVYRPLVYREGATK
jgi:FMN phosphatase YigB (HAD superfamily)